MDAMYVPRPAPMTSLIPSEIFTATTMFSPNMEIDTPLFDVDVDADPRITEIDDSNVTAPLADALVTDPHTSDPPHQLAVSPVPETPLRPRRLDQDIRLADSQDPS